MNTSPTPQLIVGDMSPSLLALPLLDLRSALREALKQYVQRQTVPSPTPMLVFQAREWVRDFFVNLAVPGAITGEDMPAIWHRAQDMIGEEWTAYQQAQSSKAQALEREEDDWVPPCIVSISASEICTSPIKGAAVERRVGERVTQRTVSQHPDHPDAVKMREEALSEDHALCALLEIHPKTLQSIFSKGVNAYDCGKRLDTCPYVADKDDVETNTLSWLWKRGWYAAQAMESTARYYDTSDTPHAGTTGADCAREALKATI